MSLLDRIYEHLKTKKKYNTLEIKYESLKQDLEDKIYENNQLKRQMTLQQNVWETRVIELEKKLGKRGNKRVQKSTNTSARVSRKTQDNNNA